MGKSRVRNVGEASKSRAKFRSSPEWGDWRMQVISNANSCCQLCGMAYPSSKLQVHHRSLDKSEYEKLENLDDFMALDSTCHRMVHALHKKVFRKKKAYSGCSELRDLVLKAFK